MRLYAVRSYFNNGERHKYVFNDTSEIKADHKRKDDFCIT